MIHTDGRLRYLGILWFILMSLYDRNIFVEAHSPRYPIHPGSIKMLKDLKRQFYWKGMKKDIATFVSKIYVSN